MTINLEKKKFIKKNNIKKIISVCKTNSCVEIIFNIIIYLILYGFKLLSSIIESWLRVTNL
jgi:hypothetical protein